MNQEIGSLSNAIEDYSKAIDITPNHLKARLNRGKLYLREGRNDAALNDYDQVLRLEPKLAEAYFYRCQTLYNIQKYQEAIKSCTKAIENDNEKKFSVYFRRALAYEAVKNIDAALRDYNQAIDQDPSDWGSYNNRGLIYWNQGDYSKALEDFTKAIENHQKSDDKTELAKIYVNRANARLQMPNPDIKLAAEDFLSANRIDGSYAPAWEAMGDLLRKYNLVYKGREPIYFYRGAADLYSNQNQQSDYQRVLGKM